jgi:cell division protein FtsB
MNRRKKSKMGLIIVLALVGYFVYTFINQQGILAEKQKTLDAFNDKYKKEMQLNSDLKKKKEIINSSQYAEDVARQELDMVKQGERIFVDVNK